MHLGGHCPGCGGGEGNQSCKIARCSLEHGKPEYCSQCQYFPCEKYDGIDEWDSFITHRNQRKDLDKQDKIGAKAYREEQKEKQDILKWLLQNYNDGRKKTFFCLAVNLLELQDLKMLREQIRGDDRLEELSVKERAGHVKKLLEQKADEWDIRLKMRKKV